MNLKKNLDFLTTEWASVPDGLTKIDKNNLRLNTTRYCTFKHRLLLYNSELSHPPGCTLKKVTEVPEPKNTLILYRYEVGSALDKGYTKIFVF